MKKRAAFILTFIMMFSLFGAFSATAWANVATETGKETSIKLYDTGDWALGIDGYDISVTPPGMSYVVKEDDTELWLIGKPTQAGNYWLHGSVYLNDNSTGSYDLDLFVNAGKKTQNVSKSVKVSVGESTNTVIYQAQYGQLDSWDESWNGLIIHSSGNDVVLSGTPTAVGSKTFTAVIDDGYEADITISVSVTVSEKQKAELKVTKSPSGETRTEGDNALFISAAENYSDVEWRILTSDSKNCWLDEDEIESKFTGVKVSIYQDDDGRECMYLMNIPLSMNGYYVETKFWSLDKSETKFTENHACLITVLKAELKMPVIGEQPQSANLASGKATELKITASSPDGNIIKYQWYKNTTASTAGGQAINGATSNKYVPDEIEGSMYYYCAVTNTKGSDTSTSAVSNIATVTYEPKPAPAATPPADAPDIQPAETNQPVVVTPTPTEKPSGSTDNTQNRENDHAVLYFVAVIVCAALACGTVIYLKTSPRVNRDDDDDDLY